MARDSFFLAALVLLVACRSGSSTTAPTPAPPSPSASAVPERPLDPESELPSSAPPLAATELAGDASCGPFDTKNIEKTERTLLDGRVSVRFLPGASAVGEAESGKIEATSGKDAVFVGARELFQRGDELFARRAAKAASFGGAYEPFTIASRDGKASIVAGVLRKLEPKAAESDDNMVSLAHGWFLDPNRDVLDVAVFASATLAKKNLDSCRRFAEKVLSNIAGGTRMLPRGSNDETETKVSYATFRYRAGNDWVVSSSTGIHDFARIHFRKRGVFPNAHTELQMALDSHPGDWKSAGDPEGDRKGTLFGLPVTWHLTRDASSTAGIGAWTISEAKTKRDHAVASLQTTTPQDRDEAIRFAESIRVGH